ncbi:MAG: pentapeptide repeat-containing protein [Proteobacteria bacterium]|nr:MAG: pentapeptide repeat-containing protein [Pseudomonadota bacterium]
MEKPKGSDVKVRSSRAKAAEKVEERLWEKNPEMTAVLLAALEENPESKELSHEQKLEVVDLALLEKRFHDPVWLTEAILNIKMKAISGKKHVEIPVSRPVLISSQSELDEVLEAHRNWINQVLQPTEPLGSGRANLKGNDLKAYNFDGVDLRSANLEGCDLSGCSFITANLSGCNLIGANLEGSTLHKAKLRKARLDKANLSSAKAFGTDFRQISCEGTNWSGSELRELVFDDSLPKKVKESMNPILVAPEIIDVVAEDLTEKVEDVNL